MKQVSKLIILLLTISILSFPALVVAATSPFAFKLLNQIYGNYDAKKACWIVDGGDYCMKITKSDIINTESGKRNYLLLTSDYKGEFPAHGSVGKVGLFIIEGSKLIAAEPEIFLGSWGRVPEPEKWNLIKLAPSDYWGWQTNASETGQGFYYEYHIIFAPYGKTGIKQLTSIIKNFNDEGTGKTQITDIRAEIKVDNLQVDKRIFPLKVKITGKVSGKKLKTKIWELPFNTKKWTYVEPKNWPLLDFQ